MSNVVISEKFSNHAKDIMFEALMWTDERMDYHEEIMDYGMDHKAYKDCMNRKEALIKMQKNMVLTYIIKDFTSYYGKEKTVIQN